MSQAAAYNRSVDTGSMPDRIRRLPISPTGYPVPWFVEFFGDDGKPCPVGEGVPDFRIVNPRKITKAMHSNLCWVCGGPMGVFKCFVIGPMCAVNRVIAEPPSHRECAIFSARACPFLSKPNMVRNQKAMPANQPAAGIPILRNPGAVCVWVTKTYRPFKPEDGGILFSLGRPTEVLWYAEGRRATRKQVMASIDSGFPLLEEVARQEGAEAVAALQVQKQVAMALIPD